MCWHLYIGTTDDDDLHERTSAIEIDSNIFHLWQNMTIDWVEQQAIFSPVLHCGPIKINVVCHDNIYQIGIKLHLTQLCMQLGDEYQPWDEIWVYIKIDEQVVSLWQSLQKCAIATPITFTKYTVMEPDNFTSRLFHHFADFVDLF